MASLYHPQEYPVNSQPVTGDFLARNLCTRVERAFLAADLVSGVKYLTAPTQLQAAALVRVNRIYVHWAIERHAKRADIERGLIPLVPPPPAVSKTNGSILATLRDEIAEAVELMRPHFPNDDETTLRDRAMALRAGRYRTGHWPDFEEMAKAAVAKAAAAAAAAIEADAHMKLQQQLAALREEGCKEVCVERRNVPHSDSHLP